MCRTTFKTRHLKQASGATGADLTAAEVREQNAERGWCFDRSCKPNPNDAMSKSETARCRSLLARVGGGGGGMKFLQARTGQLA